MKKVSVFLVLIAMLAFSIFASNWMLDQTTGGIMPTNSTYKYGGTVVVVNSGLQTPFSINPLSPQAQLPIVPEIYESLFYINTISGEITPLLGVNYKWEDNNLKLVVKVRDGVNWSDGVPFSANDVAFTFNLIKKYPAFDTSGLWKNSGLQSVEASNDTVIFTFERQNTPLFLNIADQYIVPEHIWANIKDPTTFTNTNNPVGTGPFLFKSYSPDNQTTIIVKNPNYWLKGRPYVDEVEIQNVNSNNTTLLMMLKHEADWGSSYFPDIMNIWVNKDPQTNKIFWPVNNFNALYLNTQKSPFDNPVFRKAVSIAIDKNDLEQKAYFGIGGVANPTGIVPAQLNEWLDPTLTSLASSLNTYDPQKAQELLDSIGFKKNSAGQLTDHGKVLPTFKILVGAGWTDFITQAQIISENLSKLGISTVIDQAPWSAYISSLMSGTYDMAICWGVSGPTPYYVYYQRLNPAFSASKIGESALSDYSRYTNPLITDALEIYARTSDLRLQKQAMYTIERIVLDDVPFIPLTNRTNFSNFSAAKFIDWPSDLNPYCAGGATNGQGGEIILLNIHLK